MTSIPNTTDSSDWVAQLINRRQNIRAQITHLERRLDTTLAARVGIDNGITQVCGDTIARIRHLDDDALTEYAAATSARIDTLREKL